MISVDSKQVELVIDDISDLLANANPVLADVGLFARSLILQRTQRGVDWQGKKFQNYSESYDKQRRKLALPTTRVDLFFTGHMLGSIKVKTASNVSKVYFASQAEATKASYHNNGNGQPQRRFFDLTPADVKNCQEIITDWFDNGIK